MVVKSKFNLIGFIVILMTGLLVSSQSYGLSTIGPSYKSLIKVSEKFVLANIIDRKPIVKTHNGNEIVCGWLLDVKPKHSFKGSEESFQLFTNHEEIFINYDYDYLIIAFENNDADPNSENNYYPCSSHSELEIDLSEYKYKSSGYKQFIFPLDPFAKEKFGGDWIMNIELSQTPNKPSSEEVELISQKVILENENENFPEFYTVSNLFDFLRTVMFYED